LNLINTALPVFGSVDKQTEMIKRDCNVLYFDLNVRVKTFSVMILFLFIVYTYNSIHTVSHWIEIPCKRCTCKFSKLYILLLCLNLLICYSSMVSSWM